MLGTLIKLKCKFEDHLLNIVKKLKPENTEPGKNIKVHALKEAENYYENISHNLHIVH